MNILITGGKSATALKLMKAYAADEVLLADYGEVPSFTSSAYSFISLGEKNEDTLAHNLLNHCLDHEVNAILPLYLFELEPVAKARVLFEEFGIEILLPDVTDLVTYLNNDVNKKDWSVFRNGEIIFSTEKQQQIEAYGINHRLSGAYYHQLIDNQVYLKLIYI